MRFKNSKIVFAILCVALCCPVHPANACKYNVRETGFVDLETRPYLLYIFINQLVDEKTRNDFKKITNDVLEDSNIQSEIVDVEQRPNHPAVQFLEKENIDSIPACVFVSPDSQSMTLATSHLEAELAQILSSPKRDEIVKKAIKNYAVLLFIEGTNDGENKQAYKIAESAVEFIGKKMDMLPKPIRFPPEIAKLDKNSLTDEKVLLWSLGLDASRITEPLLAVIYGKARWIGPVVTGEQITKKNLVDLLLIIGGDCECGLDKTWLQGTMLPIKWDLQIQKQVAQNLGFDAESPYVKMEMMAIMRNSMFLNPSAGPVHAFSDSSDFSESPQANSESGPQFSNPSKQLNTIPDKQITKNAVIKRSIKFIFMFLGLVVIIGLALIVFKMRRNENI